MAGQQNPGTYRVRIRSADLEVEVEAPDAGYVDAKVAELLDWMGLEALETSENEPATPKSGVSAAKSGVSAAKSGVSASGKPPSLVEHVHSVSPSGGLEHVLAVGYYLEHHRGANGGFRRRDLAQAFKTMRYNHSNPGVPIASGRRQGLLMDGAEADKIRLSETADDWVRARLRGE